MSKELELLKKKLEMQDKLKKGKEVESITSNKNAATKK